MATKYVTLKDSNGDTLYPQAVATNLAPGSISADKIDWPTTWKRGTGTLNSTYFGSGTAAWVQFGSLVIVTIFDASLTTTPPNNSWTTAAITGLPKANQSVNGNWKVYIMNKGQGSSSKALRLGLTPGSTSVYFHYSGFTGTGDDFSGQFVYLTDDAL